MYLQITGTVIALTGAVAAFIYGMTRSFRINSALYAQIMVFAAGCFMLGRLYETVCYITFGELPGRAHIGYNGTLGMVLFLLAGSRGRLDSLVDDGRKELRRYRLIPLAMSLAMLIFMIAAVCGGEQTKHYGQTAVLVIAGILMMITMYYEFKHLIFPDEGLNFVNPIRGANISALILNLSAYGLLYAQMERVDLLYLIMAVIAAVSCVALVVTADKGVMAWKH